MTAEARRRRSDFYEPFPGWQVWRRGARREINGGRLGEVAAGTSVGVRSGQAPDFVEPVIGWRYWRVVKCRGSFYLSSLFNNIAWAPGVPIDAHCLAFVRAAKHPSPSPTCHCGVYASRRDAVDWQLVGRRAFAPLVLGTVSLWGLVVEAERGWRAGHAYPERLYVPAVGTELRERDHAIAAALRVYGVPVNTVLVEHAFGLMPAIEVLHRRADAAAA